MGDELKVKIVGDIPEAAQRSIVQARFAPDAAEDVKGQGGRFNGLGPDEDDVEGQGARYGGLAPTEDDAEGQGGRYLLQPAEHEDAQGHGGRWTLKPVEGEDAQGNVLRSHVLEIKRDENGKLVGRYVRAPKTPNTRATTPRLSR
jgi:hypothetical protein